ncbi:MAG: sensor histidine kinase [Bdellovibrionota bacterium]
MISYMQGVNANHLRDKKTQILSEWEARCRKEVNSAEDTGKLALRDSLPLYIDNLSEALATNRRMDNWSVQQHDHEAQRIGKLHGADRAGTAGYELYEVIFEYHILREVIFQVLEEEGSLTAIQRDILLDSIEQAVNDAAVEFSEIQTDIQQKFVNILTHDLKTPIAAAQLNAQLIARNRNPETTAKSAQKIVESMKRLSTMIDDLLDASRVRAGQPLSLQFEECDLKATVQQVIDEVSVVYKNPISYPTADHAVGTWSCDGIRRAVENLIGNAVKYGKPDGPISVSLHSADGKIKISVSNEGEPIPPDEIPYLFDPYRRAKKAQEGNESGWGLGLAQVQGVVMAHGGTVRVESKAGTGTKFILEFPVERPAVVAALPAAASGKMPKEDRASP